MRLERWGERLTRLYTVLVYAFLFLPILIVVVYSFNAGRHVTELLGFSTKWYAEAWSDRFLMDALGNSLTIATTTAILATVFGTAIAYFCSYEGYMAEVGAEGVGRSTARAVVMTSVAILVLDAFIAALFAQQLQG